MSQSALLALAALAAFAALARTMPPALARTIPSDLERTDRHLPHTTLRTVDLAQALNHTVCPIKVYVDINENRTPRRIKMLKCAPNPNEWCRKQNIPQHECCHHRHDNHQMQCVEMQDTVLVQYKNGLTGPFVVAVGCSCMVYESSLASAVPQEPS